MNHIVYVYISNCVHNDHDSHYSVGVAHPQFDLTRWYVANSKTGVGVSVHVASDECTCTNEYQVLELPRVVAIRDRLDRSCYQCCCVDSFIINPSK